MVYSTDGTKSAQSARKQAIMASKIDSIIADIASLDIRDVRLIRAAAHARSVEYNAATMEANKEARVERERKRQDRQARVTETYASIVDGSSDKGPHASLFEAGDDVRICKPNDAFFHGDIGKIVRPLSDGERFQVAFDNGKAKPFHVKNLRKVS